MAPLVIKLIDGAFLEALLKDFSKMANTDLSGTIDWNAFKGGAHRTIYYDALPIKKTEQTDEDFQSLLSKKAAQLDHLRSLANMHVRDGITRLKTKGRSDHMREVLEQKGVDTWIAVDAMKYALSGVADEIHIYTSDSDLYPVFEALQETRCRGKLFYQEGIAAKELVYSADEAIKISLSSMLSVSNHEAKPFVTEKGIQYAWKAIDKLEFGSNVFEVLTDNDARLACNLLRAGNFVTSCESTNIFLIGDWINARGGKVTYSHLSKLK